MNEENKIMKIYWHQTRSCICLFVYSHTSNFQLSCGCHHCWWQSCKFWPMLRTQGLWAGWDLYCATPTATRNLGLIRKTGTHSGIRTPDARIKALILYLITIWNCMYMHTFYYTIYDIVISECDAKIGVIHFKVQYNIVGISDTGLYTLRDTQYCDLECGLQLISWHYNGKDVFWSIKCTCTRICNVYIKVQDNSQNYEIIQTQNTWSPTYIIVLL